MSVADSKPRFRSVGANLALFLVPVLLLNGVIFGFGWDRTSVDLPGLPPGWFVGALWVLLFVGMGYARWLLVRSGVERGDRRAASGVELLGFLCLIYPLYTVGLSNDRIGLAGNVLTLLVAVPVAVLAWRRSRTAGGCLVAVCLWLSYASVITANGLARGMSH